MTRPTELEMEGETPVAVQKKTRILDAYGNFGKETQPLIPGEATSLDSWRTTSESRFHEEARSTGVRYRNGVPEYSVRSFFRHLNYVVPSRWDVVEITSTGAEAMLSYRHIGEVMDLPPTSPGMQRLQFGRPLRRRLFLLLTEPDTSVASAIFFFILIISILVLNIVMMMQTMTHFQYFPDDCRSCGGKISYMFDDEATPDAEFEGDYDCVCPPTPLPWTETILKSLTFFFSVEWILRVVLFCPIPVDSKGRRKKTMQYINEWLEYITSWSMVLDFLAIFPYYMELAFETNGLMSLRLLRLIRVMQLVRLGQYNNTFMSLTSVLAESWIYLKMLVGILLFAGAFFGSMIYWLEKGDWMYWPETQSYQFIRLNPQGVQEISPFKSIPDTFWWFFVTATTVGYGDSVPTTTGGKWVAFFAMMTGVLVIAFPVSVFSDLWSKELKRTGALSALDDDEEEDDDDKGTKERDEEGGPSSNGKGVTFQVAEMDVPGAAVRGDPSDDLPASLRSNDGPLGEATITTGVSRRQSSSSLKESQVAIDRDDLTSLLTHVHSIQESQREIKLILRKYKPQL